MPRFVSLDDVSFGDKDIDDLFRSWREAIENANTWYPSKGGSGFEGSATDGYSINIPTQYRGARSAVVTVAITTGSSGSLGSGKAKLRERQPPGLTLRDGAEVIVLNPFTLTTPIPVGRIITVHFESPDWMIAGSNCP
jgi:hypothetical protein